MRVQPRVVVLISGRGSNLEALLLARLPLEVVAVISSRMDAAGLDLARCRGIPALALTREEFPEREAYDQRLRYLIDGYQPDMVVLAGFMRILTPALVRHYEGRLLNIHPSLLPAFPGLHTHRRALEAGVAVHGCTVHFVSEILDDGPIVAQAVVPVLPDDDEMHLAQRVLVMEHRLYPAVLRAWAEGHLTWLDGRPQWSRESGVPAMRWLGLEGHP